MYSEEACFEATIQPEANAAQSQEEKDQAENTGKEKETEREWRSLMHSVESLLRRSHTEQCAKVGKWNREGDKHSAACFCC
jgi:hypothetical protein